MKKTFSIALLLVYVMIVPIFFSGCSCEKEPELVIDSYETYISYTNLEYGDHKRQKLDLHIPKNKTGEVGLMLLIHGGGWVAGDKSGYDATLLDWCGNKGYVAAAINYRYASVDTYVGDIMNDITSALLKIKEVALDYNIEVNKMMLSGGSAGAHLSLMYAYSKADIAPIKPVAVVSYAGPTDLSDANFYEDKDNREDLIEMISKVSGYSFDMNSLTDALPFLKQASPINYITEDSVPTIICHGERDDVVPYSNAVILRNKLNNAGVRNNFVTFSNSGHGLESELDASMHTIANDLILEYANTYLN